MENRSENLGDNNRGEFNLRTNPKNKASPQPLVIPASAGHRSDSYARQRQTRRLTEHTAQEQPPAENAVHLQLEELEPVTTDEKDKPYKRAPRSEPGNPRRLRYDKVPDTPKKKPRTQLSSPAAYKPPGESKTDDTAIPAAAVPDPAHITETELPAAERAIPNKPGKLRFSENDSAPPAIKPSGKKMEKAQHKAGRSAEKLETAQKNLPKKRSVRVQQTVDPDSGKPARKLCFESEVKSQGAHLKGPLLLRPLKSGGRAVTRFAHSKVFQVEHENAGVKAAHRAEMLAEGGLRTAYRLHKTSPYRKVEKLTRRTTKLNIKASYQKTLHDNPKLKSNMFSRMAQKRKIKRRYAKMAREAKKTGKRIKEGGGVISRVGQSAVRFIKRNPFLLAIFGILALLIVTFSALFTSCSGMGSGFGGAIAATTYLAKDADIESAELAYTEWETDLRLQIGNAEKDFPGYDEYRYQAGNIGHCPYELMAFLTAVYHEFTFSAVEPVLRQIFAEQYVLTVTPGVETRYRAVLNTATDEIELEAYEWSVLTVTLTSRSFSEVVFQRMDMEQREHYGLLVIGKGNRQYAGSPFAFNWLPRVSSYYGWRVHPINGEKRLHRGIDISVPIGTDVLAAHNGRVSTGYDAGGYGHFITLTGDKGLVTKYAHLDSFLVSNGQTVNAGTVIAKSGNSGSSTGPHLHFEVIKNGRYLNPAYFALTSNAGLMPVK
jgi:murein DD-endopeptidase MepM/ murein hydrolase activator NlpD